MIKKMCLHPGCSRAAEEGKGFCAEHARQREARRAETRLFEGTRRKASAARHSLYMGTKWRAMRRAFLAEHPFCAVCGAPAAVVDHIRPHRGDEGLFYSEANLQALCAHCHSAKTLAENNFFRRKR